MKEQWKQDIQQKLADFQQPAPELSWDIIEEAVRQKRTAKKLHLVALWTVVTTAAAIALLLVGHFSLSVHQQQTTQTPLLAQPSATAPNTVQHEYSYPSAENSTPQPASSTTESIKQVFRHLAQAFSNVKDSDCTATPILTAALTSDPPNTNCETQKEGHKPLPASTLEHQTTTSTFTKSHPTVLHHLQILRQRCMFQGCSVLPTATPPLQHSPLAAPIMTAKVPVILV